MKNYLMLGAGIALTITGAPGQEGKPLAASSVAQRADALLLLVPSGWRIEKQINGHLNADKKWDAALVLVESKAATEPRRRALVVALREGKGWHRVGFNNSLLLGTRDGGAFYGVVTTPVEVSIRKRVLIVDQESGSREVLQTAHKFRFDARRGRVLLIGFDSSVRDRLDASWEKVSTNYVTGVQKIEREAGGNGRKTRRTRRVSRKLRLLEAIKGDERYTE